MALDYVPMDMLPIIKTHLIINAVVTFLAVLVVGLRVAARLSSGVGLWWDDYLILCSLPPGIGMLTIQGLWAPMGAGYDFSPDFPLINFLNILKLLVSYELIFSITISFVKLSVLMFYLRVFVNKGLRTAVKVVMALVISWSLGNILQIFLLCRPFAASYDPFTKGECGSQLASFIAVGAFNIATDLIVLSLPIPTVWSLKTTTRAKLALTAVFLIGFIVTVISIIRIFTLTQLKLETNLTGTMIWPDFLSPLETNLGILCVSLPMLGALRARCMSQRGASKLEPDSEAGDRFTEGSSRNKSSQAKNRSKQRAADESYSLEDIYAPDTEIHYQSTVAALPKVDRKTAGRDSDSETALAPVPAAMSEEDTDRKGIKVHTKWSISRE
ncbi:hypothetical protein B0T24DRAFT_618563 [Lasiosphaeria ovina]|uniref:Rhodopsin domain-containing protein n=1 Tax=Lasiosphaeria ovina TaxID=92902 RepID=A0AAE0NBC0_9PEZI|nr:hypothetical protein B0T24DRAFT_618563 [Lasiosphaeria ovina]